MTSRSVFQGLAQEVPHVERQLLNGSNQTMETYVADMSGASFAGAGYLLGSNLTPIGSAQWIESIAVSSNKTVRWNIGLGASAVTGVGTYPASQYAAVTRPGVPATIPIRAWVRGGSAEGMAVYARGILDADKAGCYFTVSTAGFQIADDLNFTASKKILFIGDSIWNGTGPTSKDLFVPWMIRKFYSDQGIDCRMINMSLSGSQTVGHDTFIKRGRYDVGDLAAIFYSVGVNDAANGALVADFRANIDRVIAWKQSHYPRAQLVIFGGTPLENNTFEATNVLMRAQALASVTAAADPRVHYCSLATAFDRTASSNYVGTDTPGFRVHPAEPGITTEWDNVIYPFLLASVPTI